MSDTKESKDTATFIDLLTAAMCDAALQNQLTQLQTRIIPPGTTKERVVRIIVIPEDMEYVMDGS